MDDLQVLRSAQRAALLTVRQALSSAERERWTAAIHDHLYATLPTVVSLVIGFYMPFRGEPDLRPLLDTWRAAGAETVLPVVVGRHLPLEFRLWWPGAPERKGPFSLPMPDGTPQRTPQVILMPPVGFDAKAYRLGYGGGYFDRTLAALTPAPLKVGVAFELARIASIDPQPHDIAMDLVVTESGVHQHDGERLVQLTQAAATAYTQAALGAARADAERFDKDRKS